MSSYYSSDWHIDHKKVLEFAERPYSSIEEMNEQLLENMFAPLHKGDNMFFLGDLAWSMEGFEQVFKHINKGVNFHWILGNHDVKYYKRILSMYNNKIASVQQYKEVHICGKPAFLCHYPMLMWSKSHYNSYMLHGHAHKHKAGTEELREMNIGKILNVNCEFSNFTPWCEDEVANYMKNCPNNWDYIVRGK